LFDFEKNNNKNGFGIFLNCAAMSHDILYYFAGLKLSWINVDNLEEDMCGSYKADNIAVYSLYKNFPYNQKDIMKWLELKREDVIPVLLTKKHLQNINLMEYVISIFDNSRYIKPATPMYVVEIKESLLLQQSVYFKPFSISNTIREKLYSAANLINNYISDSNSKEDVLYDNAKNELVYLCSYDLLKDVLLDKAGGKRMFDAAYNNIYRLLGTVEYVNNEMVNQKQLNDISYGNLNDVKKNIVLQNRQTSVESIAGGVSIYNNGILKFAQVVSKDNNIQIKFLFKDDNWSDDISFIDFYIDLNNIDGAGSTSLLPGLTGFLTTESGWEYSLRIYKDKAILYKYSSNGASFVSNLPVNKNLILIPQKYIRGNPSNWGYQSIVISESNGKKDVVDFLNQSDKTKDQILSTKPFQISVVRIR
jgi:hypothetical protein